ncbi:MAG: flagellar basal-body MS-ring/collar protein FliF [Moorellales bacterium]
MPAGRRTALVLAVAAALAALILAVQLGGREKYVPLFTNLELPEAAEVVAKLKEDKVPYRLVADGTTILVPESKVYDLRLEVAGSGLLAGSGVGFELFDKTQLGMTDTQWHLNYQRALQEELRRTIVQYDQIEQARVHLVIPQPSVFLEEARPASAAVLLKLKPMASLTAEEVRSIIYLVASSVEGMRPENVRVVDTQGRVLSEGVLPEEEAGENLLAGVKQQELKRRFEQELERRIQQKLEAVLGPGNVVVMVTADLDFSRREVTRLEYDDTGAVRSEQVLQEQGNSTGGAALPVVGDANRQPETYLQSTSGGEASYNRSQTTRNYELGKTEEKVVYAPGRVERLATAVVINGPVDTSTQQQIREVVEAAAGYNPQRGDQIALTSMAFDRTFQTQMEQEMARAEAELRRRQQIQQYVTWGATGAALLGAFILGMLLVRRRPMPVPVELAPALEAAGPVVEPSREEEVVATAEREARDKVERVREIVRRRPEEAVQLLKAWLGED